VPAHAGVLEHAPAFLTVHDRPGKVVGDAPRDPSGHSRVGEVIAAGAAPVLPHPAAVRPVRVAVVSGANVQREGSQDFNFYANRLAGAVRQVDPRGARLPGPRRVFDLGPRPAELLHPAVGPDSLGIAQRPVAVGVLLQDHDQRAALETQRQVQPPEPGHRLRGAPWRLAFADGPDSPGPVPGARPTVVGHIELAPGDPEPAAPAAELAKPGRVHDRPVAGQQQVRFLFDGRERPGPVQVEVQAGVGGVAGQVQPSQRLDHVDPVAAHLLVEAALGQCIGEAQARLLVPDPRSGVGVDDAQVRVDAEPGHQEDLTGAVMGVEVAAVVEVPVAARHPVHRNRSLVDRVFIERYWHGCQSHR